MYSGKCGNTFQLYEVTKMIFLFLVMEDTEKRYFNINMEERVNAIFYAIFFCLPMLFSKATARVTER